MIRVRRPVAGLALAIALASTAACRGESESASEVVSSLDAPAPTSPPPPTLAPAVGGVEIPVPTGWLPIPIESLGVGLAIPPAWQAILLSEAALEQMEGSGFDDESFLSAARIAMDAGAVFYAAGPESQGGVADAKLFVASDDETGLRAQAETIVAASGLSGEVVDDDEDVVRFSFALDQPAAADGDIVEASGTQWFVLDGGRLWSLLIISESADDHEDLARQLFDTIRFAPARADVGTVSSSS